MGVYDFLATFNLQRIPIDEMKICLAHRPSDK